MTTNTTYLSDLSRVRVSITGLNLNADYARVERSTDGITWTTVRGGDKVGLTGGVGKVDDYEFVAGVANTYRVTAVDAATPTFRGIGTSSTGNNAPVSPGIPVGLSDGDLMVLVASIRNSGTGVPNAVAGWSQVALFGNVAVYVREYVSGVTAPTVTFTGGVAGADTLGRIVAFSNTSAIPTGSAATQLNPSAQNIATPPVFLGSPTVTVAVGWKQDDWSSIATLPGGFFNAGQVISTAGDDAAMTINYGLVATGEGTFPPDAFVVTGGAAAISRSTFVVFPIRPFTNEETSTITPTLDSVWIKNVRRPSLNRRVTVTDLSDIVSPSRSAIVDVVGRTYPVEIGDVRGSRRLTLQVTTTDLASAADFDNALATGHTVFIQAPSPSCAVPTLYASIGDTTRSQPRASKRSTRRYFDLPLTEVAAPASTVYSDTFTYADVLATYATITDVVANNTSYSALVDKVSTAVVIVP